MGNSGSAQLAARLARRALIVGASILLAAIITFPVYVLVSRFLTH